MRPPDAGRATACRLSHADRPRNHSPLAPRPEKFSLFAKVPANVRYCTYLLLCAAVIATGCGPSDEIESYKAPKRQTVNDLNVARTIEAFHELAEAGPDEMTDRPDGMCGAFLLNGDRFLVFELWGSAQEVSKQTDSFIDFIRSVSTDEKRFHWDPPENWRAQRPTPKIQSRRILDFFRIGDEEAQVFAFVSSDLVDPRGVGMTPGAAITARVNDWRRLLSLPELSVSQWPDHSTNFFVAEDYVAIAFNLRGKVSRREAGRSGDALPEGHPDIGTGGTRREPSPPSTAAIPFEFEVPDDWKPKPPSPWYRAAYEIAKDDKTVEVVLLNYGPIENPFMMSVNFWRSRRLGLPPTSFEEIKDDVTDIAVGGIEGRMIEMSGESGEGVPTTVIGVVAVHEGVPWTFTLRGDTDLTKQEKPRFLAFLKSIQFKNADGADNDD
jgi:hypothetical protein